MAKQHNGGITTVHRSQKNSARGELDEGQRVGACRWWGGQVLEPAVCGHGFSIVQNKSNLFMAIQQCKLALIKVSHSASSEQSVNAGSLAGTRSNDPVFCPLSTGQRIHSHNAVAEVIFIQTKLLFQSAPGPTISPLWLLDPEIQNFSLRPA